MAGDRPSSTPPSDSSSEEDRVDWLYDLWEQLDQSITMRLASS
jgi:hypothetical protein